MDVKEGRKPADLQLVEMTHGQGLPEIVAPLLDLGMDREELAKALGYSRRTVDNWLALYGMRVARRYWLVEKQ